MTPLRVEIAPGLKWVAWIGIAFFGGCTLACWYSGPPLWPCFLFFVGLSVFLLLNLGPIEMNDEFIRHTSLFAGCCQMKWDEVEKIETQPRQDGDMVLHGQNKRLAVPGINLWSGKDKDAMVALFHSQVEKRGIPMERTVRAGLQMSRNTRLRGSS